MEYQWILENINSMWEFIKGYGFGLKINVDLFLKDGNEKCISLDSQVRFQSNFKYKLKVLSMF